MTLAEFKAWFDGFTEAIDKGPTQKQWARIKERVAEIDGKVVTEKIYVDRYVPYYSPSYPRPYWGYPNYYYGSAGTTAMPGWAAAGGGGASASGSSVQANLQNGQFSSTNAMYALGKAEAGTA